FFSRPQSRPGLGVSPELSLFNDSSTAELYPLSLHAALPISFVDEVAGAVPAGDAVAEIRLDEAGGRPAGVVEVASGELGTGHEQLAGAARRVRAWHHGLPYGRHRVADWHAVREGGPGGPGRCARAGEDGTVGDECGLGGPVGVEEP